MVRRLAAGAVVCVAALGGSVGIASAHQHAIQTPGGNTVVLPCEPFHGTAPGASEHSTNWDASRGLHPLHWGLHKSPSEGERKISVDASGTCP